MSPMWNIESTFPEATSFVMALITDSDPGYAYQKHELANIKKLSEHAMTKLKLVRLHITKTKESKLQIYCIQKRFSLLFRC